MPGSIIKNYYHSVNLLANELLNSRLHNINTSGRVALGLTLTINSKGYMVYDTDVKLPFFWDGTTWQQAGGTWGNIAGVITNQTDLINYLSSNYTPNLRSLTINGVTYNLTADRSWTLTAANVNAISSTLTSGNILVGNASNIATGVALTLNASSGTFGLSNTGVLTIPDASTTVRGFINTSTQVFAGNKTFNSGTTFTVAPTFSNILSGGATQYRLLATGSTGLLNNVPNVIWDNTVLGLGIGKVPTTGKALDVNGNVAISSLATASAGTYKMVVSSGTLGSLSLQDIPSISGESYNGQFFSEATQYGGGIQPMCFEIFDFTNGITIEPDIATIEASTVAGVLTFNNYGNFRVWTSGAYIVSTGYETFTLSNAAISGTTLTYTSGTGSFVPKIGDFITGPNVAFNTRIVAYDSINQIITVSISQTVSITGTMYVYGTKILSRISGGNTPGATYLLNNSVTVTNSVISLYCCIIIRIKNTGKYNIQFSAQLENTDITEQDATIWLEKQNGISSGPNDSTVAGSRVITIPQTHSGTPGRAVGSWNYIVDAVADDGYLLYWSPSNINSVTLKYYPAGTYAKPNASCALRVTILAGLVSGTALGSINYNSVSATGGNYIISPDNYAYFLTNSTDVEMSYGYVTGTSPGSIFLRIPTAGMTDAGAPSNTIVRGLVSNTTQSFYGIKTFVNDTNFSAKTSFVGASTFTAAPVFSSTTASTLLTVNATKTLTSLTTTGVLKVTAGVPSVMTGTTGYLTYWTNANTLGSFTGSGVLNIINGAAGIMNGVAETLAFWADANTIGSLALTTYPSRSEIAYVKGVTSAIQTQLDNKQPLATNLTSLAGLSYVSNSFVKMTAAGTFTLDTNTYYLASNPNSYIGLIALSSTATGLTYTNTTGVFSLTSGYVIPTTTSTGNWDSAYTNRITSLTTTGSSGSATLISNTLNIPTYTLSGLGGEPVITAGTTSQYWRGDKTWQTFPTIPTVGTWGALNYPTWTTGTPFVIMTAAGTFDLDTTIYQPELTLTTTGTSGPATLIGNTLNIPQYQSGVTQIIAGTNVTISPVGGTGAVTINSTGGGTPAGSTGYIQFNTAGAFNGDPYLFWDNTNKRLGLGTVAPVSTLQVNGVTSITGVWNGNSLNGVHLGFGSNVGFIYSIQNGVAWRRLDIEGNPLILNAQSAGKVGISTTSPIGKLQINLTTNDYVNTGGLNSHLLLFNSDGQAQTSILFYSGGSKTGKIRSDYQGNMNYHAFGNVANWGQHTFYTVNEVGNGGVQSMTLTANGNLAVGPNYNPDAYRLDVNGIARIVTSLQTPLLIGNTTAAANLTLQSTSNGTKGKILFGTSAYDEASNSLGVGTNTPYEKLHVFGNTRLVSNGVNGFLRLSDTEYSTPTYFHNAYGNMMIGNNAQWDSGGGWFYATNFAASMIQMEPSGGQILFYTAPSGFQEDPITFTETVRIINGKVSIGGIASPSYRLDVSGTTRISDDIRLDKAILTAAGSAGSAGQVLTSGGAGANFSWTTITGGVSQIIAGTNITISPTGGTGAVTINATGGGGGGINLPIPKIKLTDNTSSIQILNPATGGNAYYAILHNTPIIVAQDMPQEVLDNYQVFVEMVHYKRRGTKHIPDGPYLRKAGYVVDSDYYMVGGSRTWRMPWPSNFWNRNMAFTISPTVVGSSGTVGRASLNINRPNWYEVTSVNQAIDVGSYFNSRFYNTNIAYRDITGNTVTLDDIPTPVYGSKLHNNNPTSRFAYSSQYNPLYVAFRYIVWNPNAGPINPDTDLPYGEIISGPLSRVVTVSHTQFPFNYDYSASVAIGSPCTSISPNFQYNQLKCQFETRLP